MGPGCSAPGVSGPGGRLLAGCSAVGRRERSRKSKAHFGRRHFGSVSCNVKGFAAVKRQCHCPASCRVTSVRCGRGGWCLEEDLLCEILPSSPLPISDITTVHQQPSTV